MEIAILLHKLIAMAFALIPDTTNAVMEEFVIYRMNVATDFAGLPGGSVVEQWAMHATPPPITVVMVNVYQSPIVIALDYL